MAPTLSVEGLEKRQYGYCNGFYCYNGNSSWNNWGRWVALVCIIVFVLLLAIAFSCVSARRRRRRGLNPYYGTGWMGGKPAQYQNNQGYYGNNGGYNGGVGGPAPPYEPGPVNNQYTGNTFNRDDGYYGQQNGVELQPPQSSYQPGRGGDPVYSAPQGPPPGKGTY